MISSEEARKSDPKCGVAAIQCDDSYGDNDTPVQSQPCRDAGSRNEGGSERSSEGFDSREAAKLAAAWLFPGFRGVEDKYESIRRKIKAYQDICFGVPFYMMIHIQGKQECVCVEEERVWIKAKSLKER